MARTAEDEGVLQALQLTTGFLERRVPLKGFRRRWCVLQHTGCLLLFKDDHAASCSEAITLSERAQLA
eukprot:CAMPEP_0206019230 /NCGR_PEP_ID=MMETSP1464-20131121/28651_1 /ASSEMBLY_ACC=CAM_ASM_001124 /TAXON_ID=119497 /ORGANISM="Exanthemachrysis gayraliae, Strain RCC1523" /LENGTH=67 /DNA_ID=CAMNT_0053393123 /DNA_START=14 /DNA_END=213 /DNA_ORIENTATION=+